VVAGFVAAAAAFAGAFLVAAAVGFLEALVIFLIGGFGSGFGWDGAGTRFAEVLALVEACSASLFRCSSTSFSATRCASASWRTVRFGGAAGGSDDSLNGIFLASDAFVGLVMPESLSDGVGSLADLRAVARADAARAIADACVGRKVSFEKCDWDWYLVD